VNTLCDNVYSSRSVVVARSIVSAPSLSPRKYRPVHLITFFVFGSRVAANDKLKLRVSLLPSVKAKPPPTLPLQVFGGVAGACALITPQAIRLNATHVMM